MWVKLFVISSITTIVLLGIGFVGGIFLLIALNGFSESRATPIIIGYIVIALFGTWLCSTLVSWGFAKGITEGTPVSFGGLAGINLISLLGMIIIGATTVFMWSKLK